MAEIDRNIDMVSRDLLLARLGIRTDQIPNLMARLTELRQTKWAQFEQGLEVDRKFYMEHRPKAKPPTVLRPMSPDEYFQGNEIKTQNCEENPDR